MVDANEDGYLTLETISGKLGFLPIPVAALNQAIQRVFNNPANREHVLDHRSSFLYDESRPNSGVHYFDPPRKVREED